MRTRVSDSFLKPLYALFNGMPSRGSGGHALNPRHVPSPMIHSIPRNETIAPIPSLSLIIRLLRAQIRHSSVNGVGAYTRYLP